MRRRTALLVLLATALATTACGATESGGAVASAPAETLIATETPATADPVVTPTALVVSVSEVTLIDGAGTALASAPFTDGAAVLAVLSGAIGSTPAGQASPQYATTSYDWGAFTLVVSDGGAARINIGASAVGALQLRADAGLAVGSGVAAAMAQGAVVDPTDPTLLRYDVTGASGTTSLATPGATGVDFVAFVTDGARITRILAPADDYSDL